MESLRESDPLFMELSQLLSKENLKLFDQVTSELFFIIDPNNGDCLYISKSAKDILGYALDELTLPFFVSLIHPDDRAGVLRYYSQSSQDDFGLMVSRNRRRLKCMDFRVLHQKGYWIWIALNCVLVSKRHNGLPDVFFGGIRDITERKEEELCLMQTIHVMRYAEEQSCAEPAPITKSSGHHSEAFITPREKEVLRLIGRGFSSREIADKLFVSAHTVIKHRKNIIAKFRVKNTAQLIREASKLFWI